MNTDQNYGEGDSHANSQAKKAPGIDHAKSSASFPILNKMGYDAHVRLHTFARGYLDCFSVSEPVVAVNALLHHWLTTDPKSLATDYNRERVFTALKLVDFLIELNQQVLNLEYFVGQIKKEGEDE